MDKNKYQKALNDIIHNHKGFSCKNDSFYLMQELIDDYFAIHERAPLYIEGLELSKQLSQLQQEKEELIKWLEEELESHKWLMPLQITMWQKGYVQGTDDNLKLILSKLKESDKDVS